MKKFILISILAIFSYGASAQASIKIYTDLNDETSMFKVWINNEPQDAFPSEEVIIESLLPGKYTLQVSFNSDTIADWAKSIPVKKNEQIVYKVVKMKEFGKDLGKVGRGIGTTTGNTEENDKDNLVQYYRLEKQK